MNSEKLAIWISSSGSTSVAPPCGTSRWLTYVTFLPTDSRMNFPSAWRRTACSRET
jgi:hypothetical protein